MEKLLFIIPLLPLLGFLITSLFSNKLNKSIIGFIASGVVLGSFIFSIICFIELQTKESLIQSLFPWIHTVGINIGFDLLIDHLSVIFCMIITGIGCLIHIYSIGYMYDDKRQNHFFAYLNLFVFFMLLLVMGANYLVLFIGWEGVGLCSYLLIGFWFSNKEYNKAANKAFIMNRIGDLGLLLGLFLIYINFNSLDYGVINENAVQLNTKVLTVITLLLFIGACGKSAQIPLLTWLPDAMAGPTPVSALIHAATMVTAGIYLIIRSNILYSLAPFTNELIIIVGLLTCMVAATIGFKQNDIKKILAYSTVSQLGLMFFALGLGNYTAALFHVTTHAFFKALLFLGAGSVIHAMHHEQDIRYYGGLKNKITKTYYVMLIGTLAISGFPLLSGFFSKDEILASAFVHSPILWVLGFVASLMTVGYMFRMLFLTFYGSYRNHDVDQKTIHEAPTIMMTPLYILAFLSVIGGILNLPQIIGGNTWLHHWLEPIMGINTQSLHLSHSVEWILLLITTAGVCSVIYFTYQYYVTHNKLPTEENKVKGIEKVLANKYYIDEIYDAMIVNPLQAASTLLHNQLENKILKSSVYRIGDSSNMISNLLKNIQTGNISSYLLSMTIGIIVFILIYFFN